MGIESDYMEQALMAQESTDFGGMIKDGKSSYPCSMGTTGMAARLVAGGFSPNAEVLVTVRKSAMAGVPAYKTGRPLQLTSRDGTTRNLKIAQEGIRDCIYAWELTLDDANQNA